jgi:RNA polymerase sigma-70 factor (ECF subfamily)
MLSDEILAGAVARGDELAMTELIGRYERRLAGFVRWSLADAAELTEDVLQEVFLQLHRSASRFAGQSSFKTWLYALARNVCRHESRKLKHQPAWLAEGDEALRAFPAEALGPLDTMQRREVLDAVRAAVEALPPPYRLVLMLRDWEDLSYAEIAQVLDLPIGTVRSRLHYARALLSERLGGFLR